MPTLSPQQEDAVRNVAKWFGDTPHARPHYLAGFAGTGKSTILPYIIEECGLTPSQVAFCAPTGKAAKVMSDKFKPQGWDDVVANTIHKLIYKRPDDKADGVKKLLDAAEDRANSLAADLTAARAQGRADDLPRLEGELAAAEKNAKDLQARFKEALSTRKSGLRFELNGGSPIRMKQLVVVDEASMVNDELANDLRSFGVPILAIGDPGQLPPVSGGQGFTSGRPDSFLSEIHRQAADNPIIWLSKEIREGRRPDYGSHGDGILRILTRKQDDVTTDVGRDLQVICGTHATRWRLTEKIRKAAGYTSTGPQKDEPLIVCRNSQTIPTLVNGSFVYCDEDAGELQPGSDAVEIKFTDEYGETRKMRVLQALFEEHILRKQGAATITDRQLWMARKSYHQLDFGWVLTCHKSQGSQWDEVVVHDESSRFREDADKWLYTAVTRAAQRLTVIV